MTPDDKLSRGINGIASEIERRLSEECGVARCPFVLIAQPTLTAQYVANISRQDGVNLITGLLQRWNVPPGAADLPEHQKDETIDKLLLLVKADRELLTGLIDAFAPLSSNDDVAALIDTLRHTLNASHQIVSTIEAQIAFAREVAATGRTALPPQGERH